jgi:hypothetical protein
MLNHTHDHRSSEINSRSDTYAHFAKIQPIVGMLNSAPSLIPDGQRAVTVLVRV